MCLVVFNWRPDTEYPLILIANRDEFRARPTEPMHWWSGGDLLAGRDLEAQGTWFAIDRAGRFALVTNIRPGYVGRSGVLSRGALPIDYLRDAQTIESFHQATKNSIAQYGGFNILIGDGQRLFWFSSDAPDGQWIEPGIHALCNDALNTPWPKTDLAKKQMALHTEALEQGELSMSVLERVEPFEDEILPETGVTIDLERKLSAQTILGPDYGTRSRMWLRQSAMGQVWVDEIQLDQQGNAFDLRSFNW